MYSPGLAVISLQYMVELQAGNYKVTIKHLAISQTNYLLVDRSTGFL